MDLETLWGYKIQILPVIVTLALTELPNIIRRFKKFYYIPIYFSIFPLRELNPNLALYLGEDYFIGQGATLKKDEVARIKKKIILDSAISMLLSSIIIPWVVGFLTAFYLDNNLFVQSVVAMFIYKLINIIQAVLDFKDHAVGSRKNISLLIFIYIAYLGVFFQLMSNSYDWARPFILVGNYKELLKSLSELIFSKGIAQGLLLAGLAAFFGSLITDKNIREENIHNQNSNSEENENSE